jgi:hypothetical protein
MAGPKVSTQRRILSYVTTDAPLGQELLDIAEAEREAQIHPDGTLDDSRGKR